MDNLVTLVRQYKELKEQATLVSAREKKLKEELAQLLKANGTADTKGSLSLDVDDELSGVSKVIYQKRVSKNLALETAEDLLESKGILERCILMVPTLDEEEIMKAYYEDLLTEQDIDTMFTETVTWALVTTKR